MRHHHVAVLFHHRLFGEAIARLLREYERLQVTALPIDALSAQRLSAIRPDAIVLEDGPMGHELKASLLDLSPALTVVVGAEENTAEVYEKHEVIRATVEDIVARITSRRPSAARGASATASARPSDRTEH